MKKLIFLILLLITSCKKDDTPIITVVDNGEKLCIIASNVTFDNYIIGFKKSLVTHPEVSITQYCSYNMNVPKLIALKSTIMPDTGTYVITGIVKEYNPITKDFISELQGNSIIVHIK